MKPAYAENVLVRQGLGTKATEETIAQLEAERQRKVRAREPQRFFEEWFGASSAF